MGELMGKWNGNRKKRENVQNLTGSNGPLSSSLIWRNETRLGAALIYFGSSKKTRSLPIQILSRCFILLLFCFILSPFLPVKFFEKRYLSQKDRFFFLVPRNGFVTITSNKRINGRRKKEERNRSGREEKRS